MNKERKKSVNKKITAFERKKERKKEKKERKKERPYQDDKKT